ncbi:MAG TPA: ornithine carbamoyltransferase [Candidatus Limnocylindrales bacterium]|nr:ornithine carbamoyltransferase [Candidatus Limnocylindrales bacterium]
MGTLGGRDLVSAADLTANETRGLFLLAGELKAEYVAERRHAEPPLERRTLAMLFQKPSLRTRVTFEAGMTQLGGHAIYLTESIVLGGRETVADVARNLERFVDGIMARTGPHEVILELAARASVPVINGLTIREHPCQALADLFTATEVLGGDLRGVPLAFVGDGNNVYHSLVLLGATLGMEVRLAHPVGYGPNERIVAKARDLAATNGGRLVFDQDPRAVVEGAAIVYTDAWTSMGQEAEAEERRDAFAPYQVNRDLLAMAPDAIVMHCLPAHRGEEITSEVMDGPRSRIFEQSENRLHAQKALLVELLAGAGGAREAT